MSAEFDSLVVTYHLRKGSGVGGWATKLNYRRGKREREGERWTRRFNFSLGKHVQL